MADSGRVTAAPKSNPSSLEDLEAVLDELEALREAAPSWFVEPRVGKHAPGVFDTRDQLLFLQSPHLVRAVFPGNRWGKSFVSALDLDDMLQCRARWLPKPTPGEPNVAVTPDGKYYLTPSGAYRLRKQPGPKLAYWVCLEYGQFDDMRGVFEEHIWTAGWKFDKAKHIYSWPNGSALRIFSCDKQWTKIQGTNPNQFNVDEDVPKALIREAFARVAGMNLTRYVITATATLGLTWMYHDIYKPWFDYHVAKGYQISPGREDEAMLAQKHHRFWVLPKGGVEDNDALNAIAKSSFMEIGWGTEKEASVRQKGGFADFTGDGVFDPVSLRKLALKAREMDALHGPGASGCLRTVPRDHRDKQTTPGLVLTLTPQQLVSASRDKGGGGFAWAEGDDGAGRVTIFKMPEPGRPYVLGSDHAYGISGRDDDWGVILDLETREQVAEYAGKYGERAHRIMFALAKMYNDAWILSERQVGLFSLRMLWDEYKYRKMYFEVAAIDPDRTIRDVLGHHRSLNDFGLRRVRNAVRDGTIIVRSQPLLGQMERLKFRDAKTAEDRSADEDLAVCLDGGGSPDGCMALIYAVMACHEIKKFKTDGETPIEIGGRVQPSDMRELDVLGQLDEQAAKAGKFTDRWMRPGGGE